MKNFIFSATIVTIILTLSTPASIFAQTIPGQSFPYNGQSSTTIFAPSTETMTTTQSPPIITYPNNSVGSSITTYGGSSYPIRRYRQYSQPTVVFPHQNIYPRAIQSTCSTVIIGSPIPSAVSLDRSTGRPCN
jgi:hypothetical protein